MVAIASRDETRTFLSARQTHQDNSKTSRWALATCGGRSPLPYIHSCLPRVLHQSETTQAVVKSNKDKQTVRCQPLGGSEPSRSCLLPRREIVLLLAVVSRCVLSSAASRLDEAAWPLAEGASTQAPVVQESICVDVNGVALASRHAGRGKILLSIVFLLPVLLLFPATHNAPGCHPANTHSSC